MKNLMLFVHPSRDFLEEHKTSIKIQIDNLLSLGWKVSDVILATNFPYAYNGVKSLLVSDDNYCNFFPTFTLVNVIVELFKRKLIEEGEIYWYHDEDAFQLHKITESELNLGKADMALAHKGIKKKWDAGSIFFKSSAEDIFHWLKETGYKYQVNEEDALMALYTNNLLWATELESVTRVKFVPLSIPGKNLTGRIKTLNLRYMFGADCMDFYRLAKKLIKVVHFHFTNDLYLDSAMYGKNSLKKPLMTKRLINIFQKHGVRGTLSKKMKNLMVYLSLKKKFLDNTEHLVKKQIDNSLELGWKREDIVFVTNSPYEYNGVKATVVDSTSRADAILYLLEQGVVKEGELWWAHDLDIFQLQPIDSSQIDLEDATVGFMDDGTHNLDTGSFFFRTDSHKVFEWMRNRARRRQSDEATALMSLVATNYRNINTMYRKINVSKLMKREGKSIK